ncbi:lipase 3-like [Phlebotomus papatasi]|uniref:lipase 3-like n=1 Tax=Phlebotomus papatasi TaxID=29031 RepID=UPI0024839B11|nr:lipase 3-like [Phlebotomus papatasi]
MLRFSIIFIILGLSCALPKDIISDGNEIETTTINLDFPRMPEMVSVTGYPVESHVVETQDGYRLTMHRIPHGKVPDDTKRPVVFLQHGLLCSSADWVVIGPERALAYQLVDRGYDVWMGNARGNTYSRDHVSLDPNFPAFWDFSWHEIGMKDLPAMLDYVLTITGWDTLHYIGHSQGTTSLWVMLSLLPEYNNYFLSVSALAPVAYMSNCESPVFRSIALSSDPLDLLTDLLGDYEFTPSSKLMQLGGEAACMDYSPTQEVCSNILFLIAGYDSQQLNRTQLPAIMENFPAGASTKQLIHYGQVINSNHFRQYDYGLLGNMEKYKSTTPPDYPLEKITAPIALFYSENDWLAAVEDVDQLRSRIEKTLIKDYLVPLPEFNHIDFQYAIDVKFWLYDELINFIDSRNN